MAKKTRSKEPSVFRCICISKDCKNNYHSDFQTIDDAMQYANSISSESVEWYGVYEIDPLCDHLKLIESKRLIPYNNAIDSNYVKEVKETKSRKSKK